MKKSNMIALGVVGAIVLLLLFTVMWAVGAYNGLVTSEEGVQAQWANVESSYQRRFDLIPNLVSTVQGVADFEKDTYTAITEARSQWSNAQSTGDKIAAANGLESALSRLMVVVENYPQLKANENFLSLQDELAGTENRINVERNRYNEQVKQFNVKVRRFPTNIIAGMFGFETKNPFEAQNGAEVAPTVSFN